MAHFAKLNNDNMVTDIIAINNNELLIDGIESEQKGIDFCVAHYGGKWIQTSYNSSFRKRYAGVGCFYDPILDEFMPTTPIDSSILDEEQHSWYYSWNGEKKLKSPSILLDGVPRSANTFLKRILQDAFPTTNNAWGYMHPHNSESFEVAATYFDATVTIVRNPIDSIASMVYAFKSLDKAPEIIKNCYEILSSTNNKKNVLLVFLFDDVITDVQSVVNQIGKYLGITPKDFDIELIKQELGEFEGEGMNAVPTNNQKELDTIKSQLLEQYAEDIERCTAIYQSIILK